MPCADLNPIGNGTQSGILMGSVLRLPDAYSQGYVQGPPTGLPAPFASDAPPGSVTPS